MSYWCKLFIVVLLALILPVQSFAAVSMKCAIADTDAGKASFGYAAHDRLAHGLALHEVVAQADDGNRRPCDSCHARSCLTCASCCCFGIAVPAVPTVAMPTDATRVITRTSPSADVVSFLTDGIDRPPRDTLA